MTDQDELTDGFANIFEGVPDRVVSDFPHPVDHVMVWLDREASETTEVAVHDTVVREGGRYVHRIRRKL